MKLSSWIVVLAAAGFAMSWLGAGVARWDRDALVLIYAVVVGVLVFSYFRSTGVEFRKSLTRRWQSGVVIGLAVGALLARNVMAQPGSPEPHGVQLAWAILWLGVIYGVVDALLLNVMPVWIVYAGWNAGARIRSVRLSRAAVALGASLLVTATYHLGYEEFRGAGLMQPLIGNGLLTLVLLFTGSPAAPIIGHVIMHAAAVLHGMETTVQLPPHY
jgi:hypothetical protein